MASAATPLARKRTWAPEGQTPVLEFNFNWKKFSAIAGVSLTSVYFELHEGSVKSAEVVAFLKHLRRRIRKPITISSGMACGPIGPRKFVPTLQLWATISNCSSFRPMPRNSIRGSQMYHGTSRSHSRRKT